MYEQRIAQIAAVSAVAGGPAEAPIIECPACLDSGWQAFECMGGLDCGRRRRHRAHTYEAAEPGMFDDVEDDDEGTEADQKAQAPIDGRAPMWDDEPPAPSKAKPGTARANRKLHSHQSKKKAASAGKGRKKGRKK